MAYDLSTPSADAAALEARRDMLRDFVSAISAAVHAMPMPTTFRQAERAARAITIGDRALVRVAAIGDAGDDDLPLVVQGARLVFRDLADQVMATAQAMPLPASYLECERAFRYAVSADRMLHQLYLPPKTARRRPAATAVETPDTTVSPTVDDELDAWTDGLERMLASLEMQHRPAVAPAPEPAITPAGIPAAFADLSTAAAPSFPARPVLSRAALLNGVAAFPP